MTAAPLARKGEPVTVTVARHVAPGREDDFEEWAARLTGAGAEFSGFLGAGLLRPGHVGEDWHVVFRFDSTEHLDAWEHSPTRAEMLAEGSSLMQTQHIHRVSGLETWFWLPGRTAPAPPRWKMFLTSLVVIYAVQVLLNSAVIWLAIVWPMPLRVAAIVVVVTALMTWVIMPNVARLLDGWLYAPPRYDSGTHGGRSRPRTSRPKRRSEIHDAGESTTLGKPWDGA